MEACKSSRMSSHQLSLSASYLDRNRGSHDLRFSTSRADLARGETALRKLSNFTHHQTFGSPKPSSAVESTPSSPESHLACGSQSNAGRCRLPTVDDGVTFSHADYLYGIGKRQNDEYQRCTRRRHCLLKSLMQ